MREMQNMLTENAPARPATILNKRPIAPAIGSAGCFLSQDKKPRAIDRQTIPSIKSAI